MSFVYLLSSTKGTTYIGATVSLDRRLRQHNGEIKGGAKVTSKFPGTWSRIGYVSGFPDWKAALQFEWRWKQLSRRQTGKPLEKRFKALHHLLHLDKSTSVAQPFSEWTLPRVVTWETSDAQNRFNQLVLATMDPPLGANKGDGGSSTEEGVITLESISTCSKKDILSC